MVHDPEKDSPGEHSNQDSQSFPSVRSDSKATIKDQIAAANAQVWLALELATFYYHRLIAPQQQNDCREKCKRDAADTRYLR
jgi:hypothetical protein